jgi:hypothetical protein
VKIDPDWVALAVERVLRFNRVTNPEMILRVLARVATRMVTVEQTFTHPTYSFLQAGRRLTEREP